MTKSKKEWYKKVEKSRRERDPLLPAATSYLNALAVVSGDRQPAEHEQTAEVERRRQQDVRHDIMLIRDVLGNVIKDLEDAGFLSEEFKEAFAGKEEEEDPYQPCRNPREWWELLLCTREWISKLYRCCIEHEGRWRFWTYRIQDIAYSLYQEMANVKQRFDGLDEFEDRFPPIATAIGDREKYIVHDKLTGEFKERPEENVLHVKSKAPAKLYYHVGVTPPNDAPVGTLWISED